MIRYLLMAMLCAGCCRDDSPIINPSKTGRCHECSAPTIELGHDCSTGNCDYYCTGGNCCTKGNTLRNTGLYMAGVYGDQIPDSGCAGTVVFEMYGTVDEFKNMMFDFDNMYKHRPWWKSTRSLKMAQNPCQPGSDSIVEMVFDGKLGINPTIQVQYAAKEHGRIDFAIIKPAFGLRHFDGYYAVSKVNDHKISVSMYLWIDSGLPFVNVTKDEFRDGMFEDVRMMREWMKERCDKAASKRRKIGLIFFDLPIPGDEELKKEMRMVAVRNWIKENQVGFLLGFTWSGRAKLDRLLALLE